LRGQRLPPKTEPIQHAAAEVAEQHVGTVQRPHQCRMPSVALEIERDALLAAVEQIEIIAEIGGIGRRNGHHLGQYHATRSAARSVGLDLDDLRAQFGQGEAGKWPLYLQSEFDPADAIERPGHAAGPKGGSSFSSDMR
jgi:hypothetical protein